MTTTLLIAIVGAIVFGMIALWCAYIGVTRYIPPRIHEFLLVSGYASATLFLISVVVIIVNIL